MTEVVLLVAMGLATLVLAVTNAIRRPSSLPDAEWWQFWCASSGVGGGALAAVVVTLAWLLLIGIFG